VQVDTYRYFTASAGLWSFATGVISLVLNPPAVDVQLVASTAIIPRTMVSIAARLISAEKKPERWFVSKPPGPEKANVCARC
jgi:hypothetical protein